MMCRHITNKHSLVMNLSFDKAIGKWVAMSKDSDILYFCREEAERMRRVAESMISTTQFESVKVSLLFRIIS